MRLHRIKCWDILVRHRRFTLSHSCRLNKLSTLPPFHDSGKPSTYFITTPIFYVNSVPHIGHLYTALIADALSRWERLKNRPVFFTTGTDEHGLKIKRAAEKQDQSPITLCDTVSARFQKLFKDANINYSRFIRTTEQDHFKSVQAFWRRLADRGFIYKGTYEGWYSVSDEAFLSSDQVYEVERDGKLIMVSKESGHEVDWVKEDNYMFKLSEFSEPLSKWLDNDVIVPKKFESIVRAWIRDGLPDLSVSRLRSRLDWGIPVPDDESHTIYVWLDALVNYLTVTGYPSNDQTSADLHVVGKDILKFHAIYWPAFLIAAGFSLPKRILCHSHWLYDHVKMSKSIGNVVDPFECFEKFTVDGFRYFLLKEGVPHSDGNYNDKKVFEMVNNDLSGVIGNLLSRCTSAKVNPEQVYPAPRHHQVPPEFRQEYGELRESLNQLPHQFDVHFSAAEIHHALEALQTHLRRCHSLVQRAEPWRLTTPPTNSSANHGWRLALIHIVLRSLHVGAVLLQPVTPTLAERLLARLGVSPACRDLKSLHDGPNSASFANFDARVDGLDVDNYESTRTNNLTDNTRLSSNQTGVCRDEDETKTEKFMSIHQSISSTESGSSYRNREPRQNNTSVRSDITKVFNEQPLEDVALPTSIDSVLFPRLKFDSKIK